MVATTNATVGCVAAALLWLGENILFGNRAATALASRSEC